MKDHFNILLLAFFLSHLLVVQPHGTSCGFRAPKHTDLVNGITIDELPPHHRAKRDVSSNFRIHFDYQSTFNASPDANALQKNIMEPAKSQIQQMLIPKAPTTGILRVDRSCLYGAYKVARNGLKGCGFTCLNETTCTTAVVIPDKYLKKCKVVDGSGMIVESGVEGEGIANMDIVLLVTYIPCDGLTLAYAASCFFENTLDRPILGFINLCAGRIQPYTGIKDNIKIVMHEIIHALGLAVDKYAFYRYDDGRPIVPRNLYGWPDLGMYPNSNFYQWNDKIIKNYTRSRQSTRMSYSLRFEGFVLPNVVAAAKAHFNCPTLEAVDIEEYGNHGDGSAMSHFDEYFLYNELMTPESNSGMDTLSNITLALLQDTGWYNVNFSFASKLDYGYQKGCILPEKGCYAYMKSKAATEQLDPFCNQPVQFGQTFSCSLFKEYFRGCGLVRLAEVKPENQYFTEISGVKSGDVQFYSGSSPFSEFCPNYIMSRNPSFVCNDEQNNNVPNSFNVVPSYFGRDSMCFTNHMYKHYNNIYYGASCQKYVMIKYPNQLTILVGSYSFSCPSNDVHSYYLSNGMQIIVRCPDDLRSIKAPLSISLFAYILPMVLILIISY